MRSARMIFAAAAATAVLAITAPGAYAGDEWKHEDNGYGKEHDKKEHHSKEHDKKDKHDGHPRGGVHAGGGALTTVPNEEEWNSGHHTKEDTYKEREHGKDSYESDHHGKHEGGGYKENDSYSDHGKESYKGDHEKGSWKDDHYKHDKEYWKDEHGKPRGGVHTGGGALASPAVTAGGLAVLAVAGTGMYALRRRKTAGNVA
ncbi:hypothetical protein [Streptomyces capitiformicae]|uniref:Uncharacterized protein n=1 Tax=Streptomyces capitiformicae TaxID=2014920 RepID=A0A919GBC8_9ACTN|nr:hypothetical protein [Streptomyces capitiformicae]GHH81473.1 hypothetical protein GCM10017771_03490 [Streptomyces capitiformicae]